MWTAVICWDSWYQINLKTAIARLYSIFNVCYKQKMSKSNAPPFVARMTEWSCLVSQYLRLKADVWHNDSPCVEAMSDKTPTCTSASHDLAHTRLALRLKSKENRNVNDTNETASRETPDEETQRIHFEIPHLTCSSHGVLEGLCSRLTCPL